MASKSRDQKLSELAEQRKNAIKSLSDYQRSDLTVSSAVEYLTFVAGSGESAVEVL